MGTQEPGVRHILQGACLGFPPGVGHAEGDVLVTLLLWNNCLGSTEHFQGKGQKSGVWVQTFRHKLTKGVIPLTPNGTY